MKQIHVFTSSSQFSTLLCTFSVTTFLFLCLCDLYSVIPLSLLSLWAHFAIISLAFPQTPSLDFHDFMLMACCYSQRYHLFSTFSQLYSLYYLCPLLLFSQFIFSPILTDFVAEYCFSFYWPRPIVLYLQQQASFITQRPKVWARHWLFWRWEQNVMDFHLYS